MSRSLHQLVTVLFVCGLFASAISEEENKDLLTQNDDRTFEDDKGRIIQDPSLVGSSTSEPAASGGPPKRKFGNREKEQIYADCMPQAAEGCHFRAESSNSAYYCCTTFNLLSVLTVTKCNRNIHYPRTLQCDCGYKMCRKCPTCGTQKSVLTTTTTTPTTTTPTTTTTTTTNKNPSFRAHTDEPDEPEINPPKPQTTTTTVEPKTTTTTTTTTRLTTKQTTNPPPTKKTTTKKPATKQPKTKPPPKRPETKKPARKPVATTAKPKKPQTKKPGPAKPATKKPVTQSPIVTQNPGNPDEASETKIKCHSCESTQGDSSTDCKDRPTTAKIVNCQPGEVCRTLTYVSDARGGSVLIRGCVHPNLTQDMARMTPKECTPNPPYLPKICDHECGVAACACTCNTDLCNNVVYPGQGWNACD